MGLVIAAAGVTLRCSSSRGSARRSSRSTLAGRRPPATLPGLPRSGGRDGAAGLLLGTAGGGGSRWRWSLPGTPPSSAGPRPALCRSARPRRPGAPPGRGRGPAEPLPRARASRPPAQELAARCAVKPSRVRSRARRDLEPEPESRARALSPCLVPEPGDLADPLGRLASRRPGSSLAVPPGPLGAPTATARRGGTSPAAPPRRRRPPPATQLTFFRARRSSPSCHRSLSPWAAERPRHGPRPRIDRPHDRRAPLQRGALAGGCRTSAVRGPRERPSPGRRRRRAPTGHSALDLPGDAGSFRGERSRRGLASARPRPERRSSSRGRTASRASRSGGAREPLLQLARGSRRRGR